MSKNLISGESVVEQGIIYRILQMKDVPQAASCFSISFQREPMVKSLGITEAEFYPFALVCCEQAAHDQLGIIALDEQSGKIAGFTIVQDALQELNIDLKDYYHLMPIFEILGNLQNQYIQDKKLTDKGVVAVSFVTGVQSEFQGTQIAAQLFGKSIELARYRGYQKMITEVSGRFSQNGVRKRYHFTPYTHILYKDFLFEGELVFRNIEDKSLSCMLMERSLLN